jgi:RHS repeat-associated protein
MDRRRQMVTFALECVALFALLVNGILGPGFVGVVHLPPDRTHASSGAPVSAAHFVPTSSPALQAGTWYAPHGGVGGAFYGPASPGVPQGRKPGEQADLRTETSETFLNPDGTWTLKAYNGPIHYQDAQGKWQPIDPSLVTDSSDAGYAYGNKANRWRVHFARAAGGTALVDAQFPGVRVAETLTGAASVAGRTNGSTIVYPGVFPGVDLRYQVGATNLEEMLLLQHANAPASYTFTYHLPGATATQDASGNVIFTDAKGAVLFLLGSLLMYEADAQGQWLPKGALSEQVQLTLSGTAPDFQVTYTPDATWLADPKRHFPVAIDPSWQGSDTGQNTTNGNIYADTIDEAGHPTQNFWNLNALRIGNADNAGLCCNGVSRAYLKFPINPPPGQVRVTSADLALYQSSQLSGGGVPINVNAILSAWNATTLTWNTHPTSFEKVGSALTLATQNNWLHFDVSAAAQEWWSGGIALNGLELQYADETKPQEHFFSDNNTNSQKPTLTINYVQDTTAPGGGLAYNGGATSTNSLAVTVTPTGSDTGSVQEWSSNWNTVNGIGTNGGFVAATASVDSTHAQLNADTSSCGASQCWAQTYFTHPIAVGNQPTFTAVFKTDAVLNFHFGAISQDNYNTRFELTGGAGSAFTTFTYSLSAGATSTIPVNIPFNPNTWYYGQVVFPLPNVGEIYVWPVGQARPTTPSAAYAGLYMTNPALNFWHYGDNGANLHHYSIGNVEMTSKAGTGTGYGIYGMQPSSDGTTYGCPAYSGSGAISGGPWCVYSTESFPWTFTGTDGIKTLWWKYADNAGNVGVGTSTIIYDTTAPSVTAISPANGNEVRGIVTVVVTGTDPTAPDGSSSGIGSAILYVDGVQVGTPVPGTTTPTFTWDTTNLSQGKHVLTAKVTDRAGNTSALSSFSNTVIVSNTALLSYETLAKRTLPDHATSVSVNVANGDTVVSHTDLDIPGRGPDLSLTRTYHALGYLNGLFGQGWTSELDEQLTIPGDGSVMYREADGGIHVFLPNGSGGYLTSPGLFVTLVQNGDGTYTLTSADQTKTNFSSSGLLTSVVDRNGNTLTVSYTGGLPTTVTDAAGRTLTISYTSGHVTSIAAPGSRSYGYAYDGNGNLTDYTDPSGVVTHYTYDSSHRLLTITLNYKSGVGADFQTNVVTTLTYDTTSSHFEYNRLTRLLDPMGFDVQVQYSIPANPGTVLQTQVLQQQGVSPATYETTVYQMTADGMGAVAFLVDPANYQPNNLVTALHPTQYLYDAQENLTQVTDPDGHVTQSTYDSNNSSPLSRGNKLSQVVDPGSSPHLALTTTWTYDSANNVLTMTDPRGIVTQYTYDTPTTGNLIKVVADYVNGGPTNSDTNVTTTSTYDSYGEVLTTTDPLGIVTKYTYDTYGDVLTTIANYVSSGPTDSQTNVTTSATYDVLGEKLTATNALGVVTQYGYDILGHVIQVVANYKSGVAQDTQTNVTTNYGFDALGRQTTVTKYNFVPPSTTYSVVTLTTYDADGRVTQTTRNYINGGATDNQTNVLWSAMVYDAAGNVLVSKDAKTLKTPPDPTGNITTTVYDLDNRAVKVTVTDNATPTPTILSNSQTIYDAAGFTTETDTLSLDGQNTVLTYEKFGYDGAGRQITKTDPPAIPGFPGVLGTSNITTTTYDADSNATDSKETNAALTSPGIVTESTATFDKLNRPLTKTEQANTTSAQTTTFAYDLDGRQQSMTDPAGQTTTDTFDALGRVLTVTHPGTPAVIDYSTYDAAGERLSQCNTAGITKDTYDVLGRVLSEEHDTLTGTCAAPTLTFQASKTTSYDANSNKLTELTNFPGGTSNTYAWTYDKLDRPLTMNDGSRSYTYDINGNVTQVQVLNSAQAPIVTQNMTYDGQNRISTLNAIAAAITLHSYGYQYDAFSDRSQVSDTISGTTTTLSYSYDNLQQLTQVKQGTTTLASYTYDANSNRATLVTSAGTTTYTYDSADVLLTRKQDPNGKLTNYTYDANGNLTKAVFDPTGLNQTTTYTYDSHNRLTSITEPNGTTISFAYDADGNRVQKQVTSGSTTTTIKDVYALGHLAYQTDGTGTILATFTYDTNGTPTSVTLGSGSSAPRYYYVYDGQGTVVAMTDSSGTVVTTYSYDAFGSLTSSTGSFPNGWVNPFLYDGSEGVRYDSETGLYWMSVRAYDPTLGRFISHDPLGRLAAMGLDMRPYVYVGNNPVNYTDPTGLLCNPQADMCLWRQYFQARQQAQQQGTPPPTPPDEHHGSYVFHCSYAGDQILHPLYADPRCVAWRTWHDKAHTKQTTAVSQLESKAGLLYVVAGSTAAIAGFGLALVDPTWEVVFDVISALGGLGYAKHGLDLLGIHLPWLGAILSFWLPFFVGIGRFVQQFRHSLFANQIVDPVVEAALKAGEGPILISFKILMVMIGPLIAGIASMGIAAANSIEQDANDQASMSVSAWCKHYGGCGTEPPDSFTVTY